MAENKKSVILYVDLITTFDNLTDEEAGKLIKHYLRYVNDLNPTPPDRLTQLMFEPIKLQLKRDLQKWENIREKRVEAGKSGGLASGTKRKQNEANEASATKNQANEAVNVNVNVNDTVINKSIINKFIIPTIEEIKDYCLNRNNNINPETFHNFYSSKGWLVGKTKMKDWKACIRTWEQKEKPEIKPVTKLNNRLTFNSYGE
jgi:hypothetical protein